MPSIRSPWAALAPALLLVACTGPVPDVAETEDPLQAPPFPAIGFEERPTYVDNNVLALTFDDGPDWNQTVKVLDILKTNDVKATFFINSHNWSNLDSD